MTKKPLLNAVSALLYIVIVSFILYFGTLFKIGHNSLFAPIIFMSLFTFSAATMGHLFLYQPFVLYFDGKKKQALDLFIQTMMFFGGFTLLLFIFLFFTSGSKF